MRPIAATPVTYDPIAGNDGLAIAFTATRPGRRPEGPSMTVQLYARDVGTGTPLVLLHAFPLSSAM